MGLTSGMAARILGISNKTLTVWCNRGLLHPVRSTTGWRYFDQKEVEELNKTRLAEQAKARGR